ncbi:hypothetical protein V7056_06710 [Bacillus sp. JJ664]
MICDGLLLNYAITIVKIDFCHEAATEYIKCHSKVGRNIRTLQRDFDRWLYDRQNNHPYWEEFEEDDGTKHIVVRFNEDAYVYWLNNVRFNKGKQVAKLIKKPYKTLQKVINF